MSVVDYSILSPNLSMSSIFIGPAAGYWTSTPWGDEWGWSVDFRNGDISISEKLYGLRVRCVRGGQ